MTEHTYGIASAPLTDALAGIGCNRPACSPTLRPAWHHQLLIIISAWTSSKCLLSLYFSTSKLLSNWAQLPPLHMLLRRPRWHRSHTSHSGPFLTLRWHHLEPPLILDTEAPSTLSWRSEDTRPPNVADKLVRRCLVNVSSPHGVSACASPGGTSAVAVERIASADADVATVCQDEVTAAHEIVTQWCRTFSQNWAISSAAQRTCVDMILSSRLP